MTSPTPAAGPVLGEDARAALLGEDARAALLGADARAALLGAELTGSLRTMEDGYPSFIGTDPEEATDRALAALEPIVRALVTEARADGAAEERKIVANGIDSMANQWVAFDAVPLAEVRKHASDLRL